MKVWIVNMGVGENCENQKAMRVFETKEDAFAWVEKCFKEQIKGLKEHRDNDNGLSIGNSFHIYSMDVEAPAK